MSTLPLFAALVLTLDELTDALEVSAGDLCVVLGCLCAAPWVVA